MKGVDSDLAAHITILHHKGVTLWDVFAPVSWDGPGMFKMIR